MKLELLIIDPQNDFCSPNGSLYVPGAGEDMDRMAAMIDRLDTKIDNISVTLDSHHVFSIFHPCFIVGRDGKHPNVITGIDSLLVSHKDIVDGVWRASIPAFQNYLFKYTKNLDDNGRYPYIIWPYHCLIGGPGACIHPSLFDALLRWEKHPGMVNKVTKGSNYLTEHYSAVRAEVEDPRDKGTMLNTDLIEILESADLVPTGGEAGSHCLANTIRDIAKEFGSESVKKIVILEDATSSVPGFEHLYDSFVVDMKNLGVQFSTTTEFLA